jgi:endonuclease G
VKEGNYAVRSSVILKHLQQLKTKVYVRRASPPPRAARPAPARESTPTSFAGRSGYQPDFLGKKFRVPLPTLRKGKQSVVTFVADGKRQSVLDYEHFSLVMNKDRRLCFFSACNVDGATSKRGVARARWGWDPRLPKQLQIKEECYGNPPKFARGHMTRKEDPIWGDLATARRAGNDTFHVTNAVPQMQPFNAPVWLALEDYALENARQDSMRISVFTGPIFAADDPERDGVKIPLEFYKVIAFIHDRTRKLCATSYTVSQADSLRPEEFVYGEFKTYQVSIKSIEARTGLSFGPLAEVDPIRGEEAIAEVLSTVEDIRFL